MAFFFVLRFSLVLFILIAGYRIQLKTKKGNYKQPYWYVAIPAVFIYSVVEGFRYGRGADYISYSLTFTGQKHINYEPIFLYFTELFKFFDIHFSIAFVLCSILLIVSGFILVKNTRFNSHYAIPLFFLATISQSENLVRMFVAFSFLIIGISFLQKRKIKKASIFFVIGCLNHYSLIFVIPFVMLFYFRNNPFKNIYVILSIFIISNLLVPSMESIVYYFDFIPNLSLYSNYTSNLDIWLLGEGLEEGESSFSVFYYIRFYLIPFILLFYGYNLIKKYELFKFGVFYHLYFIGTILSPIAIEAPTEVIYRITLYFTMFSFMVTAFILYDMQRNFKSLNILKRFIFGFLIFDSVYLILKSTYTYSEVWGNLFIWDINY